MDKRQKIYTLQFWLLCLSSYLFFASFNMIIPELPSYLSSLGGEEYKGFIISLFTLTAGLSRPFSGKLTDNIGRIPVMVLGSSVCFIIGFIYPLISSVAGFLFLRLLHGFSTGFKPTGTVAYVADIVPVHRRGEAMGISSVFGTMGMASGPAIGSEIALRYSLDVMFYTSSALAILSILILIGMKETLPNPKKFDLSQLKINKDEVFDRSAIPPSIVMFLTVFSFGIVLTIIPDFSVYLGLENKGSFFTVFTISSLMVRVIAGKVSDKYGREQVLLAAAFLYAISMSTIAMATSPIWLFTGAVIYGVAVGMNSPTLFAWATDLSNEKNRGKALATVFIALEAGIMLGALLSGWVYANKTENFPLTFMLGPSLVFFAILYLVSRIRKGTTKTLS